MNKILQAIHDTYQKYGYCIIPQNTVSIMRKTFTIPASKLLIASGKKDTVNACAQWLQSHAKEKLQTKLYPFLQTLPVTMVNTSTVGRQPHVDCPLQKRKDPKYQSSFANPGFECKYCPFCLEFTPRYVSCLGAHFLDDYQDFSLSLAQRRKKYYQHTELCPECGEASLTRYDGKFGEYWRCSHCQKRMSNRKWIYEKMETKHWNILTSCFQHWLEKPQIF